MTDVAIEVLHRVLSHVIHGPREQVGVGDDQVSAFLETLKKGLCHYFLPSFLALGIGIYLCLRRFCPIAIAPYHLYKFAP